MEHLTTHAHSNLVENSLNSSFIAGLEEIFLVHSLVGVDGRIHEPVRTRLITIVLGGGDKSINTSKTIE